MNLMQMMDAAENGSLSMLWTIGYDVLLTNPNMAATRRALQKLNAVVVQDLFLNQTAREFGTIFLPACSSFEKDGTFMNAERRVQRVRQALPPCGESKPDWEILCSIARAMGKGDSFAFGSPGDVWEEIRKVWPAGAGITYERIEAGGLQWPCPDESHPGTAVLHQDLFGNGRSVALHCAEYTPSSETTSREYPLTLITGRTLQQFNAGNMTGRGGHLSLRETDLLDISAADASRLSLSEGNRIRLVSRYGQVVLPVHITDSVLSGVLFTTFHDASKCLNLTTGPLRDPATSTPEYKITAVRIESNSSPC
jgi:formate dehydrogenase major subunit